jgi:hypothetical protein
VAKYLIPRCRDCLELYGWWHTRRVPPYAANVVNIANISFLLFVISQKQMRRRAIVFREAHSTLLARPRFQSKEKKQIQPQEGVMGPKEKTTLVRTDAQRRF